MKRSFSFCECKMRRRLHEYRLNIMDISSFVTIRRFAGWFTLSTITQLFCFNECRYVFCVEGCYLPLCEGADTALQYQWGICSLCPAATFQRVLWATHFGIKHSIIYFFLPTCWLMMSHKDRKKSDYDAADVKSPREGCLQGGSRFQRKNTHRTLWI